MNFYHYRLLIYGKKLPPLFLLKKSLSHLSNFMCLCFNFLKCFCKKTFNLIFFPSKEYQYILALLNFFFQQMVKKHILCIICRALKLLSRQYFFDCQMGIGNRKIFFEGVITYYLVSIVIKMLLSFLYVWVIFHLYVGSQSSLYCAITCQIKN